jgi:hypothetical protein
MIHAQRFGLIHAQRCATIAHNEDITFGPGLEPGHNQRTGW